MIFSLSKFQDTLISAYEWSKAMYGSRLQTHIYKHTEFIIVIVSGGSRARDMCYRNIEYVIKNML